MNIEMIINVLYLIVGVGLGFQVGKWKAHSDFAAWKIIMQDKVKKLENELRFKSDE